MESPRFFPYNPRALRVALFACAVASVAIAGWAFADARATGALTAWARLGVAAGLTFAFGYVLFRVRPREGWGVRVEPLVLSVSRPLSAESFELPWSQVAEVRRDGRRRDRVLVVLRPEGRVLLARHLFASTAQFEALAAALEARAPAPGHDA